MKNSRLDVFILQPDPVPSAVRDSTLSTSLGTGSSPYMVQKHDARGNQPGRNKDCTAEAFLEEGTPPWSVVTSEGQDHRGCD